MLQFGKGVAHALCRTLSLRVFEACNCLGNENQRDVYISRDVSDARTTDVVKSVPVFAIISHNQTLWGTRVFVVVFFQTESYKTPVDGFCRMALTPTRFLTLRTQT